MADILLRRDDDDDVIRISDSVDAPPRRPPPQSHIGIEMLFNRSKVTPDVMSMSSQEEEDEEDVIPPPDDQLSEESEEYDDQPPSQPSFYVPPVRQLSVEEVNREKRNLLYQLERLASKGANVPTFTMSDSLVEMKDALERIVREREQDASVRFQRNVLLACVNGIEFMNHRFNPADIHLDGWADTVNDKMTLGDYDDIFVELAEKYKLSGRKYSPELRLMFSLGGSAVMFHMSHAMIKNSAIPGLDEVLRNNPALMRQVTAAAASMGSKLGQAPKPGAAAPGGGLFGSLFGGGGPTDPSPPPPAPPVRPATMRGPSDMNSILQQLQGNSSSKPPPDVETLSVSDSEIGSLLEATDGGIRRRRGKSTGRTLQF